MLALLCCLRIITSVPSLCSFPYSNQPSPFFTEQLTAFEVWLDHGSEDKKPPEQLPIVLQARHFFHPAIQDASVFFFCYLSGKLVTDSPNDGKINLGGHL